MGVTWGSEECHWGQKEKYNMSYRNMANMKIHIRHGSCSNSEREKEEMQTEMQETNNHHEERNGAEQKMKEHRETHL